MLEIACLNEGNYCFELVFVYGKVTPKPVMKLGIRLYLAEQSLSGALLD